MTRPSRRRDHEDFTARGSHARSKADIEAIAADSGSDPDSEAFRSTDNRPHSSTESTSETHQVDLSAAHQPTQSLVGSFWKSRSNTSTVAPTEMQASATLKAGNGFRFQPRSG